MATMSQRAIDELRQKIYGKARKIQQGWGPIDQEPLIKKACQEAGLARAAQEFERLEKQQKELTKKRNAAQENLKRAFPQAYVSVGSNQRFQDMVWPIVRVRVQELSQKETEKQPGWTLVQELNKMAQELDLTLELISTSKELREAVEGILRMLED